MTDLVARPDSDASAGDGAAVTAKPLAADDETAVIETDAAAGDAGYEWAPTDPQHKSRHLWLWIGIPAAALAIGAGAASLVLIAPGTSIAGVPVGGLTPGAAAEAVEQHLAETTLVLTSVAGDAELTGADLGASVDAEALATAAFSERPAWQVGDWFGEPVDAPLEIDPEIATPALRAALPDAYVDPTDAVIAFDPATASYVVTPAVDGAGVDVTAVQAALAEAFAAGDAPFEVAATTAPVEPEHTTSAAEATVGTLNGMLDTAGFYVGDERTVPVDRATLASWLTVTAAEGGTFDIAADPTVIQPFVDGLPAAVNRAPQNSTTIVNEAGRTLSTPTEGIVGRALESTDGIANAYADQLATGNAVYALPVAEVAFQTTTLARMLEVDLSEQRLYLKENGAVVDSWLISSGKSITPTFTGRYTIGYKLTSQTMRGVDRDAAGNITGRYEVPNVQYPMYFNGDQAFHGVYWHSNWGRPMSHGCVGMPNYRAQQIYAWAPKGVDVWIHS